MDIQLNVYADPLTMYQNSTAFNADGTIKYGHPKTYITANAYVNGAAEPDGIVIHHYDSLPQRVEIDSWDQLLNDSSHDNKFLTISSGIQVKWQGARVSMNVALEGCRFFMFRYDGFIFIVYERVIMFFKRTDSEKHDIPVIGNIRITAMLKIIAGQTMYADGNYIYVLIHTPETCSYTTCVHSQWSVISTNVDHSRISNQNVSEFTSVKDAADTMNTNWRLGLYVRYIDDDGTEGLQLVIRKRRLAQLSRIVPVAYTCDDIVMRMTADGQHSTVSDLAVPQNIIKRYNAHVEREYSKMLILDNRDKLPETRVIYDALLKLNFDALRATFDKVYSVIDRDGSPSLQIDSKFARQLDIHPVKVYTYGNGSITKTAIDEGGRVVAYSILAHFLRSMITMLYVACPEGGENMSRLHEPLNYIMYTRTCKIIETRVECIKFFESFDKFSRIDSIAYPHLSKHVKTALFTQSKYPANEDVFLSIAVAYAINLKEDRFSALFGDILEYARTCKSIT
jgi:hypothetical protein